MSGPDIDRHSEPLTELLVRLTDETNPTDIVRVSAFPVSVVFEGGANWLTIGVPGNTQLPPDKQLWDGPLTLLFAMGFELEDEPGDGPDLYLELELEEGDTWEEQALREIALQALSIMYYIYECQDVTAYELEWG